MNFQEIDPQKWFDLSIAHHEAMTKKGFWSDFVPSETRFLLAMSELYEGFKASRKKGNTRIEVSITDLDNSDFVSFYEKHIKETVEEELADAVLRCVDYIAHYFIVPCEKDYDNLLYFFDKMRLANDCYVLSENRQKDYTSFLMKVNNNIFSRTFVSIDEFEYLLEYVFDYCKLIDVDIYTHCLLKMKYNETRPYKHDKKF